MPPKRKLSRSPYMLRSRKKVRREASTPIFQRGKVLPRKVKIDAGSKRVIIPKSHARAPKVTAAKKCQLYHATERIPQHTLNGLHGMDKIIENLLDDVIRPFAKPEEAARVGITVPRGLLLFGSPGTGKTALADAVVDELQKMNVDVSYFQETGSCLSEYVGQTESQIRSLFQVAEKQAPSVIFLDELDGLARQRSSSCNSGNAASIMTTLLVELNNVKRGRVLVIAATNCPHLVDPALIRKGRFDLKLNIPMPDATGRKSIIEHYLVTNEHKLSDDILDKIAKVTENCSGSDLEALCQAIHKNAVKRVFPDGSWMNVSSVKRAALISQMNELSVENDVIPALDENVELKL